MKDKINNYYFFDDEFAISEQLPREFTISFNTLDNKKSVQVLLNNHLQVGDVIDDNSYQSDFYRYHDIFHYTFATMLGWSPCARAMIKCKRKSNPVIDKIEDGARATITEEAISMIIFNEAKLNDFFENKSKISKTTLRIIKEMTEPYEVKTKTKLEWQKAILEGYKIFRLLVKYKGGNVHCDAINRTLLFSQNS